jgi:hypothetical protein
LPIWKPITPTRPCGGCMTASRSLRETPLHAGQDVFCH